MMRIKPDPEQDGKTHINVYSRGRTELGQMLSNFYPSTFKLPDDGSFKSVEGYWYWLSCRDESLRDMYGFQAKQYGRENGGKDWMDDKEFKRKIRDAIGTKILQNPAIRRRFKNSTLPFLHYYVQKGNIILVPEADWIIEFLEEFRGEIK